MEQSAHPVDVLAHDQREEVIQDHILLEAQVDLTAVQDEPRLRFAVRSAQVPSRERPIRMSMDG
jgi:hypothetical protein